MDDTLKRLEDRIIQELRKIVDKADMSPAELETSCKAVCLLKELGEYRNSSMGWPMNGMHSEMRGRDAMTGRYMSRSDGMTDNGYYVGSYTYPSMSHDGMMVTGNSYSGHSVKDRMYKAMERELASAQNEQERQMIREYMREFMAE